MPEGRLAFLTGATGFIGSRLTRRLAEEGWRLRCAVRATSDTADLERLGAEIEVGDLLDVDWLAGELAGVDVAFHLAAVYAVGIVDVAAMERTNVGGTRAFLEACERAGVPRAVYVSSTVALGPVVEGEGDENTENVGPFRSHYERTKVEAHRLAVEAQRRGLPVTIVCPAYVYGPGDGGPGAALMADALRGRIPGFPNPPAWFSYVHVDDVAEGIRLAAEVGRAGETYVLSGEHCRVDEYLGRAAALAGRRISRLRFPPALARLSAMVCDGISRATGLRFPLTRENVETGTGWRWLHSHAKATAELGWRPRSLDEGLPETVVWVQRHVLGRR